VTIQSTSKPAANKVIVKHGAIAVGIAAVVNVVAAIGAKAADVPLFAQGNEIPVVAFAAATLVAGSLGIGLAAAFNKKANSAKIFLIITVGFTVASLASPLTADAKAATKILLGITHILPATIIIPTLAKLLKNK
jgi:Family of unknown function (DUF6069)